MFSKYSEITRHEKYEQNRNKMYALIHDRIDQHNIQELQTKQRWNTTTISILVSDIKKILFNMTK
jgi:hypothetical protein